MHGLRLKEQQAQERTHRGDVTHQQRHYHLCQRFAVIGRITQGMKEMQRIVCGNAHYNRTHSYNDDRYRILDTPYQSQ